jgi:hypothetical protein
MNIATALLQAIKERGLDNLFQVEEGAARQPKATVISTLKGQTEDPAQPSHPTPEDQLRLVIIYYLSVADHAMRGRRRCGGSRLCEEGQGTHEDDNDGESAYCGGTCSGW